MSANNAICIAKGKGLMVIMGDIEQSTGSMLNKAPGL